MLLTQEEFHDLQRLGANARAQGRCEMDNPYLKDASLPRQSGDSFELWKEKHDAWHLGYIAENAMRS